jgi:two-component system, LytTR family, sensor kinase
MKSFQSFLLFWFLPLFIIFPVIILQKNDSLLEVLSSKITFFTTFYFAIISFSSVIITKYFELKLFGKKIKILLSALSCFFLVFVFSISLHFPFKNDINLFSTLFQGLLAVGIFLIEFLLIRLFNSKLTNELMFDYSKFFYLKLLLFVFSIDFLFVFLLTLDTFINTNIIDYYNHINVFIPYLIGVVVLSFFGIVFSNKLKINSVIKIFLISFFSFLILQIFNIVKYKFHWGLVLNFFMISLFSTCLIYGLLYYFHQKKNINNLKYKNIQKDAQYLELKNQINPHFLFNNLNTLISFIEVNPTKAIDFGHNLANVYRHYLKRQEEDFVLLKDELLFIKEYLEIYKAKFENGFNFSISEGFEENQYVLSSSIQELIDNIFKHNILDVDNPIMIKIYKENNSLIVYNSLVPKNVIDSANIGLDNINKRYEMLTNSSILISKNKDSFSVQLPILILE